jgi:hypothetical protein
MGQTSAPRDERLTTAGYGACGDSECNCQQFGGSANTCTNCGHNFATHW